MRQFIWDMAHMLIGALIVLAATRGKRRNPAHRSGQSRWKAAMVAVIPFAVALVVWAGAGYATFVGVAKYANLGRIDIPQVGQFGDAFGAANSLCGALGVAGVVYALILQVNQRRDERDESNLATLISGYSALLASQQERFHWFLAKRDAQPGDPAVQFATETAMELARSTSKKLHDLIRYAEQGWAWKVQVMAFNWEQEQSTESDLSPKEPEGDNPHVAQGG